MPVIIHMLQGIISFNFHNSIASCRHFDFHFTNEERDSKCIEFTQGDTDSKWWIQD